MKIPHFSNNKKNTEPQETSDKFFNLSHSSWVVLPRVALQSMPPHWQARFFKMLRELEENLEYPEGYTGEFAVTMKQGNKYVKSVMPHYRHNVLPMEKREE